MYWRLINLPELQHLTEADRKALLRKAAGRSISLRLWAMSLTRAIAIAIPLTLICMMLIGSVNVSPQAYGIASLSIFVLLMGLFTAAIYQYVISKIRKQLQGYLQELRGLGVEVPICLSCGYAVQGQSRSCPECGAEIPQSN